MEQRHLAFLQKIAKDTAGKVLPLWGRGDKEKADQLCVTHLRTGFKTAPFFAKVIIGEGEKDSAPALFRGEELGDAQSAHRYDLAVDPLECTSFFANGLGNSLVVMALTPENTMMDCADSFYMDKIALPPKAKNKLDKKLLAGELDYEKLLPHLAEILEKKPSELTIYMLDKERHQKIKSSAQKFGSQMLAIPAGDIAGAVLAMTEKKSHGKIMADVLLGVGGSPEGIITAVIAKILGAEFFGRFAPQSESEAKRIAEKNYDTQQWFSADDFIKGDDIKNMAVILTGITDGMVVKGVMTDKDNEMIFHRN